MHSGSGPVAFMVSSQCVTSWGAKVYSVGHYSGESAGRIVDRGISFNNSRQLRAGVRAVSGGKNRGIGG